MWNWLWHLRGSIPLDERVSDHVALARIADFVWAQKKRVTREDDTEVSFRYLSWREPLKTPAGYYSWLALVAYDEGRFWIETRSGNRVLRYDLGSRQTFIFCVFGAAMFFLAGFVGFFLGVEFSVALWRGLKLAAFAFTWLYGISMLLARLRIPRAIRKAVAAA